MLKQIFLALVFLSGSTITNLAFDLQGHRGARGLMPENTLPAFAEALAIGVTTLELDVGVTSDGKIVVSHDNALSPAITRTQDGQWITDRPTINSLTLDQIKQFDVGKINPTSRTAKRFPNQKTIDGVKIPLLEEVFDLAERAGNRNVRFNIETKINPLKPDDTATPEQFVKGILDLITARELEDRVSIQSFDWRTLQLVQQTNPEIKTTYLTAQQNWLDNIAGNGKKASAWTAGFHISQTSGNVPELVKLAGGDIWSPFFMDLTPDNIQSAHNIGLQVIPWTVNDPEAMSKLIDMKVDGIITDFPDRLRSVMKSRGLELPEPTPVQP